MTLRLAFLVYVSRSGSTLLARLLAQRLENVIVIPELRLPELLLLQGEQRVCSLSATQLLALMRQDRQLVELELTGTTLSDVARQAAGLGSVAILTLLAQAYAGDRAEGARLAIYKQGALLAHAPALQQLEPTIKLLHIYRDPRAVVASALNTDRPYFSGEGFGRRDPLFIAGVWERHTAMALSNNYDGQLHSIAYESLLALPEQTLASVAGWLGLDVTSEPGDTKFNVATAEEAAHRLVHKAPDLSRRDAWQQTLADWAGYTVEHAAHPTMERAGYQAWYHERMTGAQGRAARLRGRTVHVLRTAVFLARRAADLLRRPRETLTRLKARIKRGPMA